uniref:C2H2-type domain-containing protein n=1 Tax=Timema shepardi TaxID=629360 RepID=A0A7R9AQP9_TIMSH|nr:unnamed protein product [Timema shepardi]
MPSVVKSPKEYGSIFFDGDSSMMSEKFMEVYTSINTSSRSLMDMSRTRSMPMFFCPNCEKSYQHKNTLNRHLNYECGKEPQFQCPYCTHRSKRKVSMIAHISAMHRDDQAFIKRKAVLFLLVPACVQVYCYRYYMESKRKMVDYNEKSNVYMYSSFPDFVQEIFVDERMKAPNMMPTFFCPNCGKSYQHQRTLSRHLKLECGKEPQFHCPYCSHRHNETVALSLGLWIHFEINSYITQKGKPMHLKLALELESDQRSPLVSGCQGKQGSMARSVDTRIVALCTALNPALLYGCEAWAYQEKHKSKVNAVEIRYLRIVCGKTCLDRVSNEWVLKECGLKGNPIGHYERGALSSSFDLTRLSMVQFQTHCFTNIFWAETTGLLARNFDQQTTEVFKKSQELRPTTHQLFMRPRTLSKDPDDNLGERTMIGHLLCVEGLRSTDYDENLTICGELTDADILANNMNNKNDSEHSGEEGQQTVLPEKPIPTSTQVMEHIEEIEELRWFVEGQHNWSLQLRISQVRLLTYGSDKYGVILVITFNIQPVLVMNGVKMSLEGTVGPPLGSSGLGTDTEVSCLIPGASKFSDKSFQIIWEALGLEQGERNLLKDNNKLNVNMYSSFSDFDQHVYMQEQMETSTMNPLFFCPNCDKPYQHKKTLNRHLKFECGVTQNVVELGDVTCTQTGLNPILSEQSAVECREGQSQKETDALSVQWSVLYLNNFYSSITREVHPHLHGDSWKSLRKKPPAVHPTRIGPLSPRHEQPVYCESDALDHVANEAAIVS